VDGVSGPPGDGSLRGYDEERDRDFVLGVQVGDVRRPRKSLVAIDAELHLEDNAEDVLAVDEQGDAVRAKLDGLDGGEVCGADLNAGKVRKRVIRGSAQEFGCKLRAVLEEADDALVNGGGRTHDGPPAFVGEAVSVRGIGDAR